MQSYLPLERYRNARKGWGVWGEGKPIEGDRGGVREKNLEVNKEKDYLCF